MSKLMDDKEKLEVILEQTRQTATKFLTSLKSRSVAVQPEIQPHIPLPSGGLGAEKALQHFMERYGKGLSGSAGSRYFGFVTGGATPAALAADWLTSAFDQNATGYGDSVAPLIELEAVAMLRELFGLPQSFSGVFVTGATMSNFTGLALARQWVGKERGVDVAEAGLREPVPILAGTAHSSVYKALAMLGMGRKSVEKVACLEGREAVDMERLEERLEQLDQPCIVVASAGTVNTVDYDDIAAIAELKEKVSLLAPRGRCLRRFCSSLTREGAPHRRLGTRRLDYGGQPQMAQRPLRLRRALHAPQRTCKPKSFKTPLST